MSGATFKDLQTTLSEQHEHIKALLQQVKDEHGAQREAAFARLRGYLAAHEAAEEQRIHSSAPAEGTDKHVVDERLAEETQAGQAITDLESMDVDSAEFVEAYAKLATSVVRHAEAEEHQELPLLQGTDEHELGRMREALLRVPELAGQDTDASATFKQRLESAKAQFAEPSVG
ncbi:MAG: hemerythrin domain-containing protein [Nostocoides sp.]